MDEIGLEMSIKCVLIENEVKFGNLTSGRLKTKEATKSVLDQRDCK